MIAIDTNVLVRTVVDDDPDQSAAARSRMASGPIWISLTVLLESEWVFRSQYAFDRLRVASIFRAILGRPNIQVQEPEVVAQALVWAEGGMDLADALHLASAKGCSGFASFDCNLASVSARLGGPVVEPP